MNIRLDIEYEGTEFHGWQRQGSLPTIQAHLEEVVARLERRKVTVFGAGRTDSGVHARGQVAHFESQYPIAPERWVSVFNSTLPPTIRVLRAAERPGFHAQKDAVSKIYEYRILNRGAASALDRRMWFLPTRVDWDKVAACLPRFLGKRDFMAFQGANADVKTTVRTLSRFELHEEGTGYYRFEVHGTGFLKQMVRNLVGTVMEIGEGRRDPDSIEKIFESRDRRQAGRTAPACGLCLLRVYYPGEEGATC